jgi:hypothetical protein
MSSGWLYVELFGDRLLQGRFRETKINDDQWIGLRENLQETMVFTIKYRAFL